jgi:2-isopropylmalate synthase
VGIGGLSGNKSVIHRLGEFGVSVPEGKVPDILEAVKHMAATRTVSDADLLLMAYAAVMGSPCHRAQVVHIEVSTGTAEPKASVRISLGGNEIYGEDSTGNGTVDVAVRAIRKAIGNGTGIEISSYECHGIGSGSDAAAMVAMTLNKSGLAVESYTVGTDITMVSIEAFRKGYEAVCALEELRSVYPKPG